MKPSLTPFCRKLFRMGVLTGLLLGISNCGQPSSENQSVGIEDIAANESVAAYMKSFEGRGDQTDDSQPISPDSVLRHFQFPDDLKLELLAAEPLVNQPVELNFDHRGRMWVVQYGQYPFPAGLKITGYDYHLRAQFDKTPEPPPTGVKGADSITLLEDTDGDGIMDKATPVITGLNIATSVTWGRGQIWVLNPPYLLAYPDPDGDGIPDGKPRVHLRGFGLEDTHAVANSLRWGPDGWLYGAQGSTTTATINSTATRDLHFKGQAIWRYHPETEVFELFAEGGGNTFHVEIDDKGRVYSGHNGGESRGPQYKQGAYYVKNWGKHGALTNPYALGYFPHMELEGDKIRFTHAFVRYGGATLPSRYHDALIGTNSLHNFIQVSRFDPNGSTFRNTDTERVLTSDDHWFRPVDIKAGPDGGVYLADWYDSRLSHVDPRDTWHRGSGRIYRLRSKANGEQPGPMDLSTYSTNQLIELLGHANRWFRQQALRQLGDRKDEGAIPKLEKLLLESEGQLALEALWGLNLSGGFSETNSLKALQHTDPYVRMWAIRLIGDSRIASTQQMQLLALLARSENHPEVRSQLAATAKRLPGPVALSIIAGMLQTQRDVEDPHIPLQIWWALEDKAESDQALVVNMLTRPSFLTEHPIMVHILAGRIMQRYLMAGGASNFSAATDLLEKTDNDDLRNAFLAGAQEGLRGRNVATLPTPLQAAITRYATNSGTATLALQIRQRSPQVLKKALEMIEDPQHDLAERLICIQTLGEIQYEAVIPILLEKVGSQQTSVAIRQASLQALGGFDALEIGEKVTALYPDRLRADPYLKSESLSLLASREQWTAHLLEIMEVNKQILPADIPLHIRRQLAQYENPEIQARMQVLWPETAQDSEQKMDETLDRLAGLIRTKPGKITPGKPLFQGICGTCHILFEEGGTLGPDLTGYERSNLDYLLIHTLQPSAEIREGYVNYRIQTQDGRSLNGRLINRNGTQLTFLSPAGTEFGLTEQTIAKMEAQTTSLMPAGLLTSLNDEQVRDLFAYLMQ